MCTMRARFLIAVLIVVLLPLGALGWLGWRVIADQQGALEYQQRRFVDDRLRNIDERLQAVFNEFASHWLARAESLALGREALRDLAAQDPRIRQVFVIGARGQRMHPAGAQLTRAEQSFLERSAMLWRDQDLFQLSRTTKPEGGVSGRLTGPAPARPSGWYVWYWSAARHVALWWRDDAGRVIGLELAPIRLLSDLIARLPATEADSAAERVRLIGPRGAVLYQWGERSISSGEQPMATAALSDPLHGWRVEYFGTPVTGPLNWMLILGLLGTMIAVAGLALYLYREHSREMRLAGERISFVNQVSHELKTPLTNLRLYAEMLAGELEAGDETARRHARVLVEESQRLARLIGNVLNFARGHRKRLRIIPRDVVPDEVIESLLVAFRPTLEATGVVVKFIAGAPVPMNLDPDALEQITGNLLSNIEKYAAGGGQAKIESEQRDGRLTVRVCDHGPGIPARAREKIFRPFYRVSSKLTDGVAGTGIGLSISRDLAQLHGGDLRLVPSEHGACFEATLIAQTES